MGARAARAALRARQSSPAASATAALLRYARARLTTRALVAYALRASGNARAESALFVSGHPKPDYVRDMYLHGFRELLGARCVDFLAPDHLYAIPHGTPPKAPAREAEATYGRGFTYSRWLRRGAGDDAAARGRARPARARGRRAEDRDDAAALDGGDADAVIDRTDLEVRVRRREFDVVVFGSVYRGMPLLDVALEAYPPERLLFLDGEDEHGWGEKVERYTRRGTYFMRELPDGCPIGMVEHE